MIDDLPPHRDPVTVRGFCPLGCGPTLFLADGGHITCSLASCPDPSAVDTILGDQETEHIVEFRPNTFVMRHPLRERIDDDLLRCALHAHVEKLAGPPVQPGRYRATFAADSWTWDLMPEPRP